MIKCEVNRESDNPVEIELEGNVLMIADDICNLVGGIYRALRERDSLSGEFLRSMICVAFAPEGCVWDGPKASGEPEATGQSDNQDQILAVVKEPGKEARLEAIGNSLEDLQAAVGGYIETVTAAEDLVLIVNEEGRLKGLPANCRVLGHDLVGTVVAVGVKGEEFCSLSPSALETAMDLLGGCHGEAD